jgi:hypothetical protein
LSNCKINGATQDLRCWYSKSSPLNILSPYKVELLHRIPRVLQIYDVLEDSLIEDIKKDVHGSFSRSQVYGKTKENHQKVSASRTSFSSWVHSLSVKSRLRKAYAKLQSTLGLDLLSKDACEDLQVTKYEITGHYNPHLDNIMTPEVRAFSLHRYIQKPVCFHCN